MALDLSVILPALNEGPNLAVLIPQLRRVLDELGIRYEILVVTRGPDHQTQEVAVREGVRLLEQQEPGYGGALRSGFSAAQGEHIVTMDADLSHPPNVVRDLWRERGSAEVLIASRYVPGGSARMPFLRYVLSRVLNRFFARGLSLPIRDLSSGFRLYQARLLRNQTFTARDFDILQEILVRLYAEGWRVREIPFEYEPRLGGTSNARVLPFGIAYMRTFGKLWKLRNSVESADYDDRAHDSVVPLQRYWQRKRYEHVVGFFDPAQPVLDVGCGSSRIIKALPRASVAVDVLLRKLRYARRFGCSLVWASGFNLPFADGSFPSVVCSQVIEHVPRDSPILSELCRVLAPGGRLILGTPDYDRFEWVAIEAVYARVAPGGYADEHITHYTRRELVDYFQARGYTLEATRYILRAELIIVVRKPGELRRASA